MTCPTTHAEVAYRQERVRTVFAGGLGGRMARERGRLESERDRALRQHVLHPGCDIAEADYRLAQERLDRFDGNEAAREGTPPSTGPAAEAATVCADTRTIGDVG